MKTTPTMEEAMELVQRHIDAEIAKMEMPEPKPVTWKEPSIEKVAVRKSFWEDIADMMIREGYFRN